MLGYLLDPFIQINNVNGTPIVGAKIYVYNADTTNLATTYNDFEGHLNTNPVITDDLGNATIIADDGIEYDISVYDENDLLLFTKKYVSIDKTSSAGGNTQVVAGYGVTVNRVGNTFTVSIDTDLIATKDDLNDKQDKLQGGANIEITNDNTVNVVGRKELAVQYPLKVNRTNNRVKVYLDSDFSNEFKTKQTPVEYGGSTGNYISYITQNANGEIEATVQETVLPSFDDIHAGDNISITRNDNDLTVGVTDSIELSGQGRLEIENQTTNNGSIVDAAGFYTSNLTQDKYTDISKDFIHIRSTSDSKFSTVDTTNVSLTNSGNSVFMSTQTNPSLGLHSNVGGSQKSSIDAAVKDHQYARERASIKIIDNPDSTHVNTLTLDTTDVTLRESVVGGTNTIYSLKDACTPYSAGANINITNHVVSGKDWTSDIQNAPTTYSWDVTPYSAGSNVNITNHVVSGKDWSSDISIATSGKIDKITGGAGSKSNPVYLSNTNVITPCFTEDNSVKLAPSIPSYFSGDNGGNIFLNAPSVGGSLPDAYTFRNSVVLGSQTNYRHDATSKEKYNNCIFMNSYFYGNGNDGSYNYNTLIGYNSMTNAKPDSYGNTIIGQYNDCLCVGDSPCYSDTFIGYDNNMYGDGYNVTTIGSYNNIGQHRSGKTKYPFHAVITVGERNDYQPLDASNCYEAMMIGFSNAISQSGNYKNMTIGYDNSITGNCTCLIGDSLTATNEGSYNDKVMKIGFGTCHLEIHSTGIIYKVVNGTKTQI